MSMCQRPTPSSMMMSEGQSVSGRVMEKGLENEILGAFDVELDHVDALEFLFGQELHQGRGRHFHRKAVRRAHGSHARFAAVLRVEEQA